MSFLQTVISYLPTLRSQRRLLNQTTIHDECSIAPAFTVVCSTPLHKLIVTFVEMMNYQVTNSTTLYLLTSSLTFSSSFSIPPSSSLNSSNSSFSLTLRNQSLNGDIIHIILHQNICCTPDNQHKDLQLSSDSIHFRNAVGWREEKWGRDER